MLLLRLDADSYQTTVLLDDAQNARLSPDGRWLTYQSDRSGRNEIYLRRFNTDTSLGPEIPVWDSRDEFGDTNLLVATDDEARSLVKALGPHSVVLLRHHGAVVVGASLRDVVFRTNYVRVNAEVQLKAMALGGHDPLTPGETERAGAFNLKPHAVTRSWDRWVASLDAD